MTLFYSKTTGTCYRDDTEYADKPDDLVEISDEIYDTVIRNPDPLKIRSNDANGLPILIDPPAPTQEELAAAALAKRDELLAAATARIAPLQDAVDLDEATDEETAQLKAWKKYRVALNRIQTQAKYPATIDWPAIPAQ